MAKSKKSAPKQQPKPQEVDTVETNKPQPPTAEQSAPVKAGKPKRPQPPTVTIVGTGTGYLSEGKEYQYPAPAAEVLISKGHATLKN